MPKRTAKLNVTLTIAVPDSVQVPLTGPYSMDSITQTETLRWIERAEKLTRPDRATIGVEHVAISVAMLQSS